MHTISYLSEDDVIMVLSLMDHDLILRSWEKDRSDRAFVAGMTKIKVARVTTSQRRDLSD